MRNFSRSRRLPVIGLLVWFWIAGWIPANLAPLAAADDGLEPPPDAPAADEKPAPDPDAPPAAWGDLGQPAPEVELTPADYVPMVIASIDNPAASLKDLQAFLNKAVPVATVEATAALTQALTHVSKLKSIDQTRPLYGVALVAKPVFALKPANLKTTPPHYIPLWIGCVPVTGEKEYLDQLGEEVEEIAKDGDYHSAKLPGTWKATYFRFGHNYMVFCDEKIGVDAGLDWLAAQEKSVQLQADAKDAGAPVPPPPARATARYRIPVSELFAAAGLNNAVQRRDLLRLLSLAAGHGIRDWNKQMQGRRAGRGKPGEFPFTEDPEQLLTAFQAGYDLAAEVDSFEITLRLSAERAEAGYTLVARPGTELAKSIAAMPAVELDKLHGLPTVASIVAVAGSYDGIQLRLLKILAPLYRQPFREMMDFGLKAGEQVNGGRFRVVLGVDEPGEFRGAADLILAEGNPAAGLLESATRALDTSFKKMTADIEKDPDVPVKLTLKNDPPRDEDGWKVFGLEYIIAPRDGGAGKAADETTTFRFQAACKDNRVQYGIGSGAHADEDRKAFGEGKTKIDLDAKLLASLTQRAQEQHGTLALVFQPYPWIKRAIRQFVGDPKVEKLAEDDIGKATPLTFEVFAEKNLVSGVMRLDADTIKAYAKFGVDIQQALLAPAQQPADQPPGGADEAF